MKQLKTYAIIHIFAVIHVIATLLCRLSDVDDSLLLTLLTMAMTVIVCFRRGLSVEFTAAFIVIVNIAGYLIGVSGARLIGLVSDSVLLVHALSTFLTTEIMGWSIIGITKLLHIGDETRKFPWALRLKWLIVAVAVIFVLRLAYTGIFNSRYFSAESTYRIIRLLASNSVALLLMLCADIIYIRYMRKRQASAGAVTKDMLFIIFVVAVSAIASVIAGYNLPFRLNPTFTMSEFLLLFIITLLVELLLYCILYMVDYVAVTRNVMVKEREKAHQAQFQYLKLKQQVNPHFLFNSLNILDCMVREQKNAEASEYIHKLAGTYRYMLQNETKTFVRLKDELTFVKMYEDLLTVRFPDGFRIDNRIPDELLDREVVPCSIQMLVENAIKHNATDAESPLTITMTSDGSSITVSNNINPKITAALSTKVGLNYIRQQYLDLTGQHIWVSDSSGVYSVTLPLI